MTMIVTDIFRDKYMTFGYGGDKHPKGWCKCRVYPKHKALSGRKGDVEYYQYSKCPDCEMVFFRAEIGKPLGEK